MHYEWGVLEYLHPIVSAVEVGHSDPLTSVSL